MRTKNRKGLLHASLVLQLNSGWMCMNYRPVKDAFRKMFNEDNNEGVHPIDVVLNQDGSLGTQTQVIETHEWIKLPVREEDDYIGLAHGRRIRVPRIIIARNFSKITRVKLSLNKKGLYTRDRGKCGYCQTLISYDEATVDHIHPKSLGGPMTWENTALCCKECNRKKANLTIKESGMTLHIKAREPREMPMMPDLLITGLAEHKAFAKMAA